MLAPTLVGRQKLLKAPIGARLSTLSAYQPPRITGGHVISLRTTRTISESPMFQSDPEAIDMAEIPGMETRTGANLALRYNGGPISFTDTTSRSLTARRIKNYRWIRTTLFDVLATGWRGGQE